MLAELRLTPVGSRISFARLVADRVLIELSLDDRTAAEGELVRSLAHVRELSLNAPLERLLHSR